ncbi:hypothetical protein ABZP36_009089 [Zizania latifolia]
MAMASGQRRQEFSFQGTAAAAGGGDQYETARLPRPPGNPMAARAGEEETRWLQASRVGSPESGTPSPQFWGHHHGQGQYEPLNRLYPASAGSSPSRAHAIAGYRREMLDLVRGLPESAYELSLRDIVESPAAPPLPLPPPHPLPPSTTTNATASQPQQEQERSVGEAKIAAAAGAMNEEEAGWMQRKKQGKAPAKARKQRTMRRTRSRSLERSVSLDTGLLIKLFLPLSVGWKKVSPKPPAAAGGKKTTTKPGKKQEFICKFNFTG